MTRRLELAAAQVVDDVGQLVARRRLNDALHACRNGSTHKTRHTTQ